MSLQEATKRFRKWKPTSGRYGIEIETEVAEWNDYPTGFLESAGVNSRGLEVYNTPELSDWVGNSDGSLRNVGIEFIFKKPLDFDKTLVALEDFGNKTKDIKFLEDQPSTSVHVHINFGPETLLSMANFITVWSLFENLLLDFSGEGRRSNLFASGLRTSEGIVDNYITMFTRVDCQDFSGVMFGDQNVKYAALNLASINRFGSIEIRSFRGTTEVSEISEWIRLLDKLFEFSKTPGLTPASFLSSYRERGTELLTDVFGDMSSLLKVPDYEIMIETNLYPVFKMVSSVKNWDTYGLIMEEVKPKKKTLSDFVDPVAYAELLNTAPTQPWAIPTASLVIPDEIEEESF